MLVQFESGPHLYRSVIFHVSLHFGGRTYINRPSPITSRVQFESGPHLYRSVIFYVSLSLSRDRTYIDRSSFYQFVLSLVRLRVALT